MTSQQPLTSSQPKIAEPVRHTPAPWEAQPFDAKENGIALIGLRSNDGVPYDNPTNGMVAWVTLHPTEMDAGDATRAEANAAFIVEAVNSHASLKEALRRIRDFPHNQTACEQAMSQIARAALEEKPAGEMGK